MLKKSSSKKIGPTKLYTIGISFKFIVASIKCLVTKTEFGTEFYRLRYPKPTVTNRQFS